MTRSRGRRREGREVISPIQATIEALRDAAGEDVTLFARVLEEEIERTSDPGDRFWLRDELKEQYHKLGDRGSEERLLIEDTVREPANPLSWTGLAGFYWTCQSDLPIRG